MRSINLSIGGNSFEPHTGRAENFHHPRHLMLNLLSIERMIERNGKVSGVFG